MLNNLKKKDAKIDLNSIRRQAHVFDALGDPCRLRIIHLLLNNKGLCVSEVAGVCGVTVSASSQQLKILELTGIIKKKKLGQATCFEFNKADPFVSKLLKIIKA